VGAPAGRWLRRLERRSREIATGLVRIVRRLRRADADGPRLVSGRAEFARVVDAQIAAAREARFALVRIDVRGLSVLQPPAATATLRWFAGILAHLTRSSDARARLEGDAFAVLLLGSDSRTATRVIERLRSKQPPNRVELGFGVAIYPDDGESADELLRRAEEELSVLA
jgi:GGDEF domain-containing protein